MLSTVGLISEAEFSQISSTLKEIESELDADKLPMRMELEDIHMHLSLIHISEPTRPY